MCKSALVRGELIMLKYLPIVLCCTAQRKYSLCSKVFPVMLKILPIMLNKISLDIHKLISRLVVSSIVNDIIIALYTQALLELSCFCCFCGFGLCKQTAYLHNYFQHDPKV